MSGYRKLIFFIADASVFSLITGEPASGEWAQPRQQRYFATKSKNSLTLGERNENQNWSDKIFMKAPLLAWEKQRPMHPEDYDEVCIIDESKSAAVISRSFV